MRPRIRFGRGAGVMKIHRIAVAALFGGAKEAEAFQSKAVVKRVLQNDVPNG